MVLSEEKRGSTPALRCCWLLGWGWALPQGRSVFPLPPTPAPGLDETHTHKAHGTGVAFPCPT